MKKILALTLAAVMASGMTTVAFAADAAAEVNLLKEDGTAKVYVDTNDDNKFNTANDKVDGDDNGAISVTSGEAADISVVRGGKKVAIPLLDKTGATISDKDDVKGYKVKAEWTVGSLDEKPIIEQVKIGEKYVYAITFVLPEGSATKTADLGGKISVYKNSSDLKDEEKKPTITMNIGSEYGFKAANYADVEDDLANATLVQFKEADGKTNIEGEQTLAFGDDFEFEVDVTGQGKLNLKNNRKFNAEFGDMYDYANIDFITFEYEPSFNKTGVAYIYADEDAFIYEVTADGAKEIRGAKYDEDEGGFVFKTRALGSYAISDVELDEKVVTDEKEESSKPASSNSGNSGKPNPDTGR